MQVDAHAPSTPLIDSWVEEDGEDAVLAAVDAVRDGVRTGRLAALRNARELHEHWESRRRQQT